MGFEFVKKRWKQYTRTKRWWSILLDFLFLFMVIIMIVPTSRREVSSFVVRQTLLSPGELQRVIFLSGDDWEYELVKFDGTKVRLSDFSEKPIFLTYWSTKSPSSIAALPSMQNLHDRFNRSVNFIFVSEEPRERVKHFLKQRGFNLPQFSHDIAPLPFKTSVLPTTVLIGTCGRVIMRETGAARWDSRRVFQVVDSLISTSRGIEALNNESRGRLFQNHINRLLEPPTRFVMITNLNEVE